jgi:hypothetical protein
MTLIAIQQKALDLPVPERELPTMEELMMSES